MIYEPVSKEGAAVTKGLMLIRDKLGKPTDCSTNTGWIMLDNIIQVWQKYWPHEVYDWNKRLKVELETERSMHDAVAAGGGYVPVSYPTRLFKMISAMLPEQKLNEKKFLKEMTARYPFFKSTNYKL